MYLNLIASNLNVQKHCFVKNLMKTNLNILLKTTDFNSGHKEFNWVETD